MGTQTGDRRRNRATIAANTAAIFAPTLWIGGVPFAAQWTFAILACVAAWTTLGSPHLGLTSGRGAPTMRRVSLRLPRGLLFVAVLSALTTLWVLPMPPAFHSFFLPQLTALRAELLPPETLQEWAPISLAPGQTLAEAARVAALGLLFYSCRQVPRASVWAALVLSASLCAVIGLIQFTLDIDELLGFYVPMDQPPQEFRPVKVLMSTFVNPNHQAGYFLLAVGTGAALIRRLLNRLAAGHASSDRRLSELALLSLLVSLLSVALMLTYSRAAMVMLAALLVITVYSVVTSGALKGSTIWVLCLPLVTLVSLFAWSRVTFAVSWSELWSLTTLEGHDKLRILSEHRNLLPFSRVIGLGRGSASDLLPLMSTTPSGRTITHVESMPLVLLLEYGAVIGAILIAAIAAWFVHAFRRRRDPASTIILATLVALCCQNLVDFNLEFSGVAAPAVALASTVAPASAVKLERTTARRWMTACTLFVLALLALSRWQGGSWASQRELVARVQRGFIDLDQALRRHPFDARLHLYASRSAIKGGDLLGAKRAANSARRLEPAAVEPHLLVAQIEQRAGNERAARVAYEAALSQIAFTPSAEFTAYLVTVLDAEQLAAVAPSDDDAFFTLARALLDRSPRHVLSMTRSRAFQAKPDPEALVLRIRAATLLADSLLATTEALHLIRIQPTESRSYQLYARAIRSDLSIVRERELQEMLADVLRRPNIPEEQRLALLLLESAIQTHDVALVRSTLDRFRRAAPPPNPRARQAVRWRTQLLKRAERLLGEPAVTDRRPTLRQPDIESDPDNGARP